MKKKKTKSQQDEEKSRERIEDGKEAAQNRKVRKKNKNWVAYSFD